VREDADPGAVSGPLRGALRWFFAGGVAAFVALIAGVVSLLFTLFPDLKPFTPTDLSANLRVRAVERGVTRDQWRWREAFDDPGRHAQLVHEDQARLHLTDSCAGGAAPGYVVYVETHASGFKRRELTLRAQLYDAHSQRTVPVVGDSAVLARVPVDAPTAASVQQLWLLDPGVGRDYFARVEIYDPGGHLLDFADSRRFRRLTQREVTGLPHTCVPRL
jgi:hypothetical protein